MTCTRRLADLSKQISLPRSCSFCCICIYKDLAPPEPFFNRLEAILSHGFRRWRPVYSRFLYLVRAYPCASVVQLLAFIRGPKFNLARHF